MKRLAGLVVCLLSIGVRAGEQEVKTVAGMFVCREKPPCVCGIDILDKRFTELLQRRIKKVYGDSSYSPKSVRHQQRNALRLFQDIHERTLFINQMVFTDKGTAKSRELAKDLQEPFESLLRAQRNAVLQQYLWGDEGVVDPSQIAPHRISRAIGRYSNMLEDMHKTLLNFEACVPPDVLDFSK